MQVGLLGGSYNPIHNGHIELAQWILNRGLVDEVWLMVSPQNPLKQNVNLLPEDVRLKMAQVAVQTYPGIRVSDFEFGLPRPSYTWNTLQLLSAQYPNHTFSLIIGSDNWRIFDKWYKADEIIQHYRIIVYPRQGSNDAKSLQMAHPHVQYVEAPLYPISSTQIREKIKIGEDCSAYLPQSVYSLIRENGYYV